MMMYTGLCTIHQKNFMRSHFLFEIEHGPIYCEQADSVHWTVCAPRLASEIECAHLPCCTYKLIGPSSGNGHNALTIDRVSLTKDWQSFKDCY